MAGVQRLKQRSEFERALQAGASGVVAKGVHFVLHHVAGVSTRTSSAPSTTSAPALDVAAAPLAAPPASDLSSPVPGKLSTGTTPGPSNAVDVCEALAFGPASSERTRPHLPLLVGVVLPKRWARRSVTRTLLKRQVYAAAERRLVDLPAGVWVVRLRTAFDRKQFPSAASDALRLAARAELDALFTQAVNRLRRAGGSARG